MVWKMTKLSIDFAIPDPELSAPTDRSTSCVEYEFFWIFQFSSIGFHIIAA